MPPPSSAAHTCGQILRSTALIGGSSVATMALGVARTKAIALLLGPAGVGLLGLYGSIVDLAQSLAGLGVSDSGVRQIAAAAGSGEADRIARTAVVLRRTSFVIGGFGALLLVVFSEEISTLTFGGAHQATAVALLSVAVFLRLVAAAQAALLQGLRRISDLARLGAWAALFGTLVTIPAVYYLREEGIALSLVAVAATGIVTSWWYARRVSIRTPPMPLSEIWPEASALLKLGVAFMISSFSTLGSVYAIRITVLRTVGVEEAGLYQAAWALGSLYLVVILHAMGADFYPRLAAVAERAPECNRLVNEQAHVGLLLAGPGVLATITGAPLVLALFYSAAFSPAVEILRWICLGMTIRVMTWPLGFVLIARGERALFLATDLAWSLVHVGLAWVCVRRYGADGAGMAFFGSYVVHAVLLYPVVRRLTAFRWSRAARRSGVLFLATIGLSFSAFWALPPGAAAAVGAFTFVVGCAHSVAALLVLTARDSPSRPSWIALVRLGSRVWRARRATH